MSSATWLTIAATLFFFVLAAFFLLLTIFADANHADENKPWPRNRDFTDRDIDRKD